jgi:hypothetical protein
VVEWRFGHFGFQILESQFELFDLPVRFLPTTGVPTASAASGSGSRSSRDEE